MSDIKKPLRPMPAMESSCSSLLFNRALQGNDVGLFAHFGGQGASYLEELRSMFMSHHFAHSLIEAAEDTLKTQHASHDARSLGVYYKEGLNIREWLQDEDKTPSEEYLVSCPISYPLILLTQLCQYFVTAKLLFTSDKTDSIAELRKCWKGTTGHSQGVVASIVISTADSEHMFFLQTCKMVSYLFWQGARLQQCFDSIVDSNYYMQVNNSTNNPEAKKASPLLAIFGVPADKLKRHIDKANQLFSSSTGNRGIEMSLFNGPRATVCSGNPALLSVLVRSLQQIQAKPGEDQSRIPFSKRKPGIKTVYLSVTVPFHSTSMSDAAVKIREDLKRLGITCSPSELGVPVYSTFDGSDLRKFAGNDLMEELTLLQCVKPVYWAKALTAASSPNVSHVVDFGPGGVSGAGSLVARLKDGTGVIVIYAGQEHVDLDNLDQSYLFSKDTIIYGSNWAAEYSPKVVKLASGELILDTKFSRLIGKPPIMVAGMTPTTANEHIVAAFTNSGFHGELAGGGQATEEIFKERIRSLVAKIHPGEGIHLNLLFLNPRLWGFQFPLALEMKEEGYPIDSITVAAGVPSLEKANEIISAMKKAGMKFVAFKPGSVASITEVIAIAQANRDFTILVQWTGGRAGGHHSFEDIFEPIIETYSALRRQRNIVLIIGGGLGGADDALQFLKGTWSLRFGCPLMPFDGILLGSRIMVAKEALTSDEAKELIVKTPGVTDGDWEKSYEEDAGGVITVISELGEPIHKIATRGVQLWREFDRKFFSLPIAQQEKALLEHKEYIIQKLNADYQKVWFGKKNNGKAVDVEHMTYSEVLHRMVEIMFVETEWIHSSYMERFVLFLQRTEERFFPSSEGAFVNAETMRLIESNPTAVLEKFEARYPRINSQILAAEDVDYFILICRERGKPVNFIPLLDKDFSFWFKKDSLWQSENLRFVQDRDVGRVCILQGPVAVSHSTKANVPVGEILGELHTQIIELVKKSAPVVNSVEYLDSFHLSMIEQLPGVSKKVIEEKNSKITELFTESGALDTSLWTSYLAGTKQNWWTALLTCSEIVQGKLRTANRLPSLVKPRQKLRVRIEASIQSEVPVAIKVFEASNLVAEFSYNDRESVISVIAYNTLPTTSEAVPLKLTYKYRPDQAGYAPIHALPNNQAIKSFYSKMWFSNQGEIRCSLNDVFDSVSTISRADIENFSKAIRCRIKSDAKNGSSLQAPIDYVIVACWESMIKTLFAKELDANLLSLLHLSYSYKILAQEGDFMLSEGDVVNSKIRITEVMNMKTGKRVSVKGILYRASSPIVEVVSQFFFPGSFDDYENTFFNKETQRLLVIEDKKLKAVIESKPWFKLDSAISVGDKLLVQISSTAFPSGEKLLGKIETVGVVSKLVGTTYHQIGSICLEVSADKGVKGFLQDPVEAFLERYGKSVDSVLIFENGGYSVLATSTENDEEAIFAPEENMSYSLASGDFNPIHTNPFIADLVGLPATITHGMWTAAIARNVIEKYVAKKEHLYKVKSYQVNFVDKVKPNDRLSVRLTHTGMKNGLKMIQVEVVNEEEVLVLKGTAEVEQPGIAYVFTGQGSAEIGMGMDLYKASAVAKDIWDRAEQHMVENFGFSLMTIINKNPKEITVNFGGPKGAAIRAKYGRLKHEITTIENGVQVKKLLPLFPEIGENSDSYTFQHPEGLLYATQFTQPAITLVEKASFSDMQTKGLVPKHSMFAGHSLGEYAALASVGNVLSVEALVELLFIRGITMQNAVSRDEQGRSCFGMVAVNTQRVGPFFTPQHLHEIVELIAKLSGRLLQIVNYNVENWQYIATGYNSNLETLRLVLNALREDPLRKENLVELIQSSLDSFKTPNSVFVLEQGVASIPLPGIDVPFHSQCLLDEVPRFRDYLLRTLDPKTIDVSLLEGNYIPNLTAIPFKATMEYAQHLIDTMPDTILKPLLQNRKFDLNKLEDKKTFAYYLLTELLAFQFASPVKWIETQDYFFKNGVEILIEVGPSMTLKGMAARTLSLHGAKYGLFPQRETLSVKQDREIIYFEHVQQQQTKPRVQTHRRKPSQGKVSAKPASEQKVVEFQEEAKPEPKVVEAVAPPKAAVISTVARNTISSFETLQILLAVKLKKTLNEITAESTIKELVGGKSAIQNEILGDLQKEFGTEPEGAASQPLAQLAQQLGGTYTKLGTQSQKLISRVLSSKMPAGFGLSEVQDYLAKERELNDVLIESVLMHSLLMEPEGRIENAPKAKEWLDKVADSFGGTRGVAIGRKGASSGGAQQVTKAIDSEELYSYQRKQESFVREQMVNYAKFLGLDLRSGELEAEAASSLRRVIENDLRFWETEHGKAYSDGIRPLFDANKIRRYNSFWNWARQEAFSLFYDTLLDNPQRFDSNYCKRVVSLINRATPELVELVDDISRKAFIEGNSRIGRHVEALTEQIREHLHTPPVFRILCSNHEGPSVEVTNEGRIVYKEVARANAKVFDEFVKEMKKGFTVTKKSAKKKRGQAKLFQKKNNRAQHSKRVPYLFVAVGKPEDPTEFDPILTNAYYSVLSKLAPEGISFHHKTALVTGCGKGSIGIEVVKGLLAGGAKVVITTSRFSTETTEMYRKIYEEHGGKDSELIIFPFNQASSTDVNDLIKYIYAELGFDLDYILPFAALSEAGRDIGNLDSLSELSHRVMLTNLLRMVGKVKNMKQERGIETNPTYVVLPLSPNHGVFGSDGLYAESKIGLETVFNRWASEGWQNYISITGAVIGWTRGTGLMEGNNLVAQGIEQIGVRTFNQSEMAYSILGLLAPEIVTASQQNPLWADMTGGMLFIENLKGTVTDLRTQITENAEITRAIRADQQLDEGLVVLDGRKSVTLESNLSTRSNFYFKFPDLPKTEKLSSLSHLRGMVDLSKTVVIVGMGEVGPWGNTRTRWEIEQNGEFSIEGCIELAWIMGMIKYHNGPLKDGRKYVGWVDAKSMSPVKDLDVKRIYEESILQHCGVREIEPELFNGYNPHKKMFLHEVALNHDMEPIEVFSQEEANQFKLEQGEKVDIYEKDGRWYVQMKKGANMFVPRALKFDRFVAGQVPTGWNAALFGIPKDIIDQVDQITLYNLVSTCEALLNAGIIDPYEFYEYVHVSEVGNAAGGGIGGLTAIRKTYRERFLEKPIQADILQEVFINVMPAWVNLLLLSSSGPIKTPVGACATAAESVEIGVDCIQSGKARIVIVGGYDDFGEESSYEFAQMKATSNSAEEVKMGRSPREMSRPVSDTRAGFMESQGAGTQLLMSADLALRMGVPIYGIVALTNTATDKAGRSVPAPGRGLLTTAKESQGAQIPTSMLLDIKYRKRQLEYEREAIQRWKEYELELISLRSDTESPETLQQYRSFVDQQVARKEKTALSMWGNEFYLGNDNIAPIRGALAVWGLTIDDLGVASFHGTGTKANDLNESQVTQMQMEHLGRKKGNALLTIFQKYLTGHPKGAAAAWMANGLVQCLLSGIVPGNKNADNVDAKLRSCDYLVYTTKSIQTTGLKAGVLKSFGFGQASAEVLIIHPDYLFATLDAAEFEKYAARRSEREAKSYVFHHSVLSNKKKMITVKEEPPYAYSDETDVYLDPKARASYDPKLKTWRFSNVKKSSSKPLQTAPEPKEISNLVEAPCKVKVPSVSVPSSKTVEVTMRELAEGLRQPTDRGIGVDVQFIHEINVDDQDFLQRNYTDAEITYCKTQDREMTRSRFAGRWAAKEAVIKAISSSVKESQATAPKWKGGEAALKGIEILPSELGPPKVRLYQHAEQMAKVLGISEIKVSISHSGEYAVAQAIAK